MVAAGGVVGARAGPAKIWSCPTGPASTLLPPLWALSVGIGAVAVVEVVLLIAGPGLSRAIPAMFSFSRWCSRACLGGRLVALGVGLVAAVGFAVLLPPIGSPEGGAGHDVAALVLFVVVAVDRRSPPVERRARAIAAISSPSTGGSRRCVRSIVTGARSCARCPTICVPRWPPSGPPPPTYATSLMARTPATSCSTSSSTRASASTASSGTCCRSVASRPVPSSPSASPSTWEQDR